MKGKSLPGSKQSKHLAKLRVRSDVQFVLVSFQTPLPSDCQALVAAAKENNLQDLEVGITHRPPSSSL